MTLSDSDFAEVLNHLYVMSRETRFDDQTLAESLMRAAVLLLTVRHGRGPTTETKAEDMLRETFEWCRQMTPNSH